MSAPHLPAIQWYETETAHCYNHDNAIPNKTVFRALKGHRNQTEPERHGPYLTAEDAALSLRWRKQIEVEQRWQSVLPKLEALQLPAVSLEAMQELEAAVIDAMDAQHRPEMEGNNHSESAAYLALEQMLTVLEEAMHCLRHKMYFERLSCSSVSSRISQTATGVTSRKAVVVKHSRFGWVMRQLLVSDT